MAPSDLRLLVSRRIAELALLKGISSDQILMGAGLEHASFESILQGIESAASALGVKPYCLLKTPHQIELEMDLDPDTLMDIMAKASRLKQAVKGWVAEYHLEQRLIVLKAEGVIDDFKSIEKDGKPDFEVVFKGRSFTVEVKNVMSGNHVYRSKGKPRAWKVDFQKTRNQLGDAADESQKGKSEGKTGRFYKVGEFDVLAAALHNQTNQWEFLFIEVERLPRDPVYGGDCIKKGVEVPLQPTENWRASLPEALNQVRLRKP